MKNLFLQLIFLLGLMPNLVFAQKACTQVFKFGLLAGAWQGENPFSGQGLSVGNETYLSSSLTWGVNFTAFSGKRANLAHTNAWNARDHVFGLDGIVRYYFGDDTFEKLYIQTGIGAAACLWRLKKSGQMDTPAEELAWSPLLGTGYQYRLNDNWLANIYGSAHLPVSFGEKNTRFWWQIGVQFGFIVR